MVRDWLVHLRLNFQLYLSPIFLWGYLIAGGRLGEALLLGFVAFHLFGYAGGTAFNSYYDCDTGPIGGLEKPPAIPRGLLPFSIVWQLIGQAMAFAVSVEFAAIYFVMFWLSVAYSHPFTRFKGKPLPALATVAIGQGVLGYLGGWVCAGQSISSMLDPTGILGAAAAMLITVGFYPLTGIYQIDQDAQRGDRTLAVWLGPARAFRFALACLALGGLAAVSLIILRYQLQEAIALGIFVGAMVFAIWRWSRLFDNAAVIRNYRICMRLYASTSLAFLAWIGLHLLGVL